MLLDLPLYLAATDIAASTQAAIGLSQDMSQNFWSQIFQSGLFGAVTEGALYIAGGGFLYRGYHLLTEMAHNSDRKHEYFRTLTTALIALILTWVMLTNHGEKSMYGVLALRNATGSLSDKITTQLSADYLRLNVNAQVSDRLKALEPFQKLETEMKACSSKPDKILCLQAATAVLAQRTAGITDPTVTDAVRSIQAQALQATQVANSASTTGSPPGNLFSSTVSAIQTTSQVVSDPGKAMNDLATWLIATFLQAMAICFFIAIDMAMLLLGLTFPINLALSLFDPGSLISWIGNFWTLANAKLCFSIVTGIIVYFQLWAEKANYAAAMGMFVIELMFAIFSPFITYYYCQGSSLALAGAIGSAMAGAGAGVGIGTKKAGSAGIGAIASKLAPSKPKRDRPVAKT